MADRDGRRTGERPCLSVVVPVYNAAASLPALHRQITAVLQNRFGYEVLYVEDCSTDESRAVLRGLAAQDRHVKVLCLPKNSGQQHATLCGMAHARGRYIANMDDDCQHPARLLPAMLRLLQAQKLDIVYAVPRGVRHAPHRLVGGAMRDAFFALLYHKPQGLRVSSFRIFTAALARRVLAQRAGFNYFSAMVFSRPVRAQTVCYAYRPRAQGRSGYSLAKRARLYFGILLHYGPLGALARTPAPPFVVSERLGFDE